MSLLNPPLMIVSGYLAAAVGLAMLFFRRREITRPPIGTLNLADVTFAIVGMALLPYAYIALPVWAVAVIAGGIWGALISLMAAPVVHNRVFRWSLIIGLIVSDVAVGTTMGIHTNWFFLVNDTLVLLVAIAAANLWAQSGLRLRDLAILALGLTAYDVLATAHLTLMTDLLNHLNSAPLQPVSAWNGGHGAIMSVGLGDTMVAALFPLVLLKGYGTRMASMGAAAVVIALTVLLAVIQSSGSVHDFPAMAVIGPIIIAFWAGVAVTRRHERTTIQCRMDWALQPLQI